MIERVIDARKRDLGGFEVARVLPFVKQRMVGPFIFFDHMGPADFAPGQGIDVRPHPHIGLSTLTYLLDGEIIHRDSLNVTAAIRPGEVNWMTAGRGIVHSERTDPARRATGARLEGLQAWIALPVEEEDCDPAFEHYGEADLPAYSEGGLSARLVAGEAYGAKAGVAVKSPLFYIHWTLQAGTKASPPSTYSERAVYVVRGEVEVDGQVLHAGQMAVLAAGSPSVVSAVTDSVVMALGGEPVGPRYLWWNLVSSQREKLIAAKADWQAGRFLMPKTDCSEWIPAPDDPLP